MSLTIGSRTLTSVEIMLCCMLLVLLAMVIVLVAYLYRGRIQDWLQRRRDHGPLRLTGSVGGMQIHRFIEEGGMADVYAAVSPVYGKVALKILKESLMSDQEALSSFHNEGRVLQELHGGPVPKCYDSNFDPYSKRAYIALEFIEGQNLKKLLDAKRSFSRSETLAIMRDLARSLVAVHGANYCHMDVSAQNVMVQMKGNQVTGACLIDFGSAERPGGEAKGLFGKWLYMPPEQYWESAVSPACDIYSLGILYYYLLFGAPPFEEKPGEPNAIMVQHRDKPASYPLGADPETVALTKRLIAKRPEERPTAAVLLQILGLGEKPKTEPVPTPAPIAAPAPVQAQIPIPAQAPIPTPVQAQAPAPPKPSVPSAPVRPPKPTAVEAIPAPSPPVKKYKPVEVVGEPKRQPKPEPVRPAKVSRPRREMVARNLVICMIFVLVLGVGGATKMLMQASNAPTPSPTTEPTDQFGPAKPGPAIGDEQPTHRPTPTDGGHTATNTQPPEPTTPKPPAPERKTPTSESHTGGRRSGHRPGGARHRQAATTTNPRKDTSGNTEAPPNIRTDGNGSTPPAPLKGGDEPPPSPKKQ
jgi:serine/threonine protein kinase